MKLYQNPNCDCAGSSQVHCDSSVRILPMSGGSNLHVCRAHYVVEMQHRHRMKATHGGHYEFPAWTTLEIYREWLPPMKDAAILPTKNTGDLP